MLQTRKLSKGKGRKAIQYNISSNILYYTYTLFALLAPSSVHTSITVLMAGTCISSTALRVVFSTSAFTLKYCCFSHNRNFSSFSCFPSPPPSLLTLIFSNLPSSKKFRNKRLEDRCYYQELKHCDDIVIRSTQHRTSMSAEKLA